MYEDWELISHWLMLTQHTQEAFHCKIGKMSKLRFHGLITLISLESCGITAVKNYSKLCLNLSMLYVSSI